jgi:molybdopterin-containing oxidoreductase family membrane subunit
MFHPTLYDMGVYLFTFGFFFTAFFMFAKFFPVINIAEIKSILKSDSEKGPAAEAVIENANQ